EHKVVLMSATPQNLGPRDIYRQLRLFLDETDHGLHIEPLGLEDFFRAAEEWYKYRAEFENWQEEFRLWQLGSKKGQPPATPQQPKSPKANIEQVLLPVLIRRRRKDIEELYGDTAVINGKPVVFPEPVLDNLEYLLDHVYAKAGSFADLESKIKQHHAYRYRPTKYLKEEVKNRPEYRDLWRARNRIARLMGALLFKRLESSIEAFRATLRSLMRSNRNFKDALEGGLVPIGATATRLLAGESIDADELLDILQKEEEQRRERRLPRATLVHSTDDFKAEEWLEDLDKDYAVLSDVAGRVAGIEPKDDDKLQSLKRFLATPAVTSEKIIIFSEAETTVDYLYAQLNPGDKDPTIAKLSGSNRSSVENVIKRFSPTWNLRRNEKIPGPEIRMLIATDVVSEGQNLQDCGRVLNYDLHWNPVRLVQRFGRVDRIGTEYAVIHLHNMWPDLDIDHGLSLTDRLLNRIQTFHDLIGLDSRLLSDSERLNSKAMYRIYQEKKLPDADDELDDVAAYQRGAALLQRIQAEDPELWNTITRLPDGIRSAVHVPRGAEEDAEAARFAQGVLNIEGAQMPLMSPAEQAGVASPFDGPKPGETIVLLSTGGVTDGYAVGNDLTPRKITSGQLIAAVECRPDTPASPLPPKTNERVMAAFGQFKEESRSHLGRARRPTSDTRLRRYLSRQLSLLRAQYKDNLTELRRVDTLRLIFLDHLPPRVAAALQDVRDLGLEGDALIRRLEALRERYRLSPPDPEEAAEREPEVVRIVCSDGLL
ncbi:MAG: C-terminal helicase domain-containing protein, partial [Dehalococcoidia bacterium]|nr:C-terminal helicase domain-containing protein [Dehalococcoidia bacterium]